MSGKPKGIAVAQERIEKAILFIRGQKVILDRDPSKLYGVTTSHMNRAVRRNSERFPDDFMFQITKEEVDRLRCQFGISKSPTRGGRRYLPLAFTEQGVAMLSSVLHSDRAIQVNIAIMRAFVRLREILSTHKDLARKLEEMERRYDSQFQIVFEAIRQLMAPAPPPPEKKKRIGFGVEY